MILETLIHQQKRSQRKLNLNKKIDSYYHGEMQLTTNSSIAKYIDTEAKKENLKN